MDPDFCTFRLFSRQKNSKLWRTYNSVLWQVQTHLVTSSQPLQNGEPESPPFLDHFDPLHQRLIPDRSPGMLPFVCLIFATTMAKRWRNGRLVCLFLPPSVPIVVAVVALLFYIVWLSNTLRFGGGSCAILLLFHHLEKQIIDGFFFSCASMPLFCPCSAPILLDIVSQLFFIGLLLIMICYCIYLNNVLLLFFLVLCIMLPVLIFCFVVACFFFVSSAHTFFIYFVHGLAQFVVDCCRRY